MTSDRLTRQAIRAARRAERKAGHPLTRQEILALRVQTANPWKRLTFILIGLGLGALAYFWSQKDFPPWIWIITSAAATGLILFGVFGRRRTIEQQSRNVKELGPDQLANLIEAIMTSLDGL